jgi:hypothetical protein
VKVLVCGGRDFENWWHVEGMLDLINGMYGPITLVITGACCDKDGNPRGADWWAERWARKRAVRYVGYPANFQKYGKPAGPMRNGFMFGEQVPSIVIAFPGGRGTANMLRVAEDNGLERRGKDMHSGTVVLYDPSVPEPKPMDLTSMAVRAASE